MNPQATPKRETVVVFYSQDVRCGGCGARMRVTGDSEDPLRAATTFVVSCPNCQCSIGCNTLRPIVPKSVQVLWYQHQ